ncbi:MAG: adenosylhomocysteinase [Deinococcus sp.]|nr:adenosylhomocysteinase [Deinococcus sp.]
MKFHVKSLDLAPMGVQRIQWADWHMPVLARIRQRFEKEQPLKGLRMACCLHVTTETANLMRTLQAGGALVVVCASNPLSTQDDVAAALVVEYKIPTFAIKGEDNATYYQHLRAALETNPQLTMDDGCDLVTLLHTEYANQLKGMIGGTEETTTGVIRLKAMEQSGALKMPVLAVNDAMTKHFFDNRYGTGQSAIDGLLRATNLLLAGAHVVVCGYGWVGKGLAARAHGMGARVTVTEVDPIRALEAAMDGFAVQPVAEAVRDADVVLTATGSKHVLDKTALENLKDGAMVGNAGHFNVEINLVALEELTCCRREVRPLVHEHRLKNGKLVYLLAEGRLLNLAAAEGHPAVVMDMSFAGQALGAEYLVQHAQELDHKVYVLPEALDREIARLKLEAMGLHIDQLTPEQQEYLRSWQAGT